ncbi:9523_t:CDS:2, partial [Racocetra persica]
EEDVDDMRTAKDIENMRRSLHKKEIINCDSCQQKTNQWEFNDLEQQLCSNCQEKENQ